MKPHISLKTIRRIIALKCLILLASCGSQQDATPLAEYMPADAVAEPLEIAVTGQTLLKVDPRSVLTEPFGSVRPLLAHADIAFTNFEMAVNPADNRCGMPKDFVVVRGEPALPPALRPGNTLRPHAVSNSVMELLASMNFGLMSLANNHSWDLGRCGILASIEAAEQLGITHAGTGKSTAEATRPAYRTVKGQSIALIAANTSDDEERHIVANEMNGIWIGYPEDIERNLSAVREAAENADFVIFYHHFQIGDEHLAGIADGATNDYGHHWVESVDAWQTNFARDVLDAGASIYIGHGHRGFDGLEIYKGRPLFRQLGGFAYHGRLPNPSAYDEHFAWWGLVAQLSIAEGRVRRIAFHPLDIDSGRDYVDEFDIADYLARRGSSEIAASPLAEEILLRFQALSADYGTDIVVDGSAAHISLDAPE